jgi:hypothetical protein
MSEMITREQIKKIHTLKRILFMSEDEYRGALAAYAAQGGGPVTTSKEMTKNQASSFINRLERVATQIPGLRERHYASPRQMRFIEAMWRNVSRAQDPQGREKAMETFLKRRFHVNRTDKLTRRTAGKVIQSLRAMNDREDARRREKDAMK